MSMRVALVSRELDPFWGGGIGEYVSACSRLLARLGEVTIFTSDAHAASVETLRSAEDPRAVPDEVELVFVPDAGENDLGGYFSKLHLYSARVFEALRDRYGTDGPDLVEFSDYLGEGAVTVQARRTAHPLLRRSVVAVRVHTSAEVCAVLNGHLDGAFASRMTYELERLAIRDADYLIWPGGDTLNFYRRFYGPAELAPGWRVLNPVSNEKQELLEDRDESTSAFRLLHVGSLERRKGVQNLVRAVNYTDSEQLRLDVLGEDTQTAPLGKSMEEQLRMMAVGDPRIRFLEPAPRTDLASLMRSCDCVVLPSLWEAWPYAGLEALRLNRPILATPVGGFTEMVRPTKSGWLTADTTTASLAELIERLLSAREESDRMRVDRLPVTVFSELTNPYGIARAYQSMLTRGGRWSVTGAGPSRARRTRGKVDPTRGNADDRAPTGRTVVAPAEPAVVSIVIPYYRLAEHIEEAVSSALDQTHPRTEVIVVNDGSTQDRDWILGELATHYPIAVISQMNSGPGAARNFGISQSRGRFVIPLDADNVLEPTFVERTLAALDLDPGVAFATTWSRYIDEGGAALADPNLGYQPIGNASHEVLRNNVAGDTVALLRRWLFDTGSWYSEELTSYEDWHFYQQLHVNGHFGVVVPERLVRYRVREKSTMRQFGFPEIDRLSGELSAHLRERQIQWMSVRD
jgi:glycosyltransferase involved in cell wall biosynthesis